MGDKTYKVHPDGYNFLANLTGQEESGPRDEFFYFSDDGDWLALRYRNWKVHFMVQDQEGTLEIWQRMFRGLRMRIVSLTRICYFPIWTRPNADSGKELARIRRAATAKNFFL